MASLDTPARPKSTQDPAFSRSTLQKMRSAVVDDAGPCVPVITLETFFAELLPSLSASPNLVDEIEQDLRASGKLIASESGNTWSDMPICPCESTEHETKAFAGLALIIQLIIHKAALAKDFDPELVFQADGNNPLPNINPQGSTTKPDGLFSVPSSVERATLSSNKSGIPWWEQVLLSGEFKKHDKQDNLIDDVEKLLWNMNHVMRSDPRRRFTFGITAENTTMRLWYCCRSTVAVTQPFDYFKQPCHLIRLAASLACATDAQRGFDPSMRLVPGWEKTRVNYDIDVYTDADTPPTTYRSTALLSDFGAHALRGRATRVFQVQRLVDGKPTGEPHALKDVWVDHDREVEGKLLEDIEASIGEEDKEAFRKHFMTKLQHGYVYVPNGEGKLVVDRAFTPTTIPAVDGKKHWLWLKLGSAKQGPEVVTSGRVLPPSKPPNWAMIFSDKNHYRIVFKDVGTPVFQITSVKTLFKVLADIIRALEILHRAGWLHRDLSPSNVYLHDGNGKLSDLEYAKKHADDSKHEVRTGTAQFMAVEVEGQAFDWAYLVPFRSNGLHDIESSLWIAIWMVFFSTPSVSDEPPASGTDTSKQLVTAHQVVYESRSKVMTEGHRIFPNKFHDLDSSVAFIGVLLVKVRDIVSHHYRVVGAALEEGTVDIQVLYTSVYSDIRTIFQKISDEAPQNLYLHFIVHNPSPKRKGMEDSPEVPQSMDKASQAVDEVPPAKKMRQ